jgi:hypothetical protein
VTQQAQSFDDAIDYRFDRITEAMVFGRPA